MTAGRMLFAAGLALSGPGLAQADVAIDLGPVTRLACSGIANPSEAKPLETWRLAEAVLLLSGHRTTERNGRPLVIGTAEYQQAVLSELAAAFEARPANMRAVVSDQVQGFVRDLNAKIRERSESALEEPGKKPPADAIIALSPLPPKPIATDRDRLWPFLDGVQLVCTATKPVPTVVEQLGKPTGIPRLGLVGKVEALASAADGRAEAPSATVSLKRTIVEKDDGSRKKTTDLGFDGVLGWRLTGDQAPTPAFLFADYTLARSRERPAPVLASGARRSDGDTHNLELGLQIAEIIPADVMMIDLKSGYIFDFVHDSERVNGQLAVTLQPRKNDLGICAIGELKSHDIGGIRFRTRCSVSLEAQFSAMTRNGRAEIMLRDDRLALGGLATLQLAPPAHVKQGVVGNLSYRHWSTVSGKAPDIGRLEAALKYRWWFDSLGAFDFGIEYKNGREEKTYQKEDILQFSFGILF